MKVFQIPVLIVGSTISLLVYGLFEIMRRMSPVDREYFIDSFENFAILWGMMIAIPPPRSPSSGKLRILFVMWSVYCLHWYSAYNTQLCSNVTQMKYLDVVIHRRSRIL